MLETPPPVTAEPRAPVRPDAAVEEYSTEAAVLPSFHVWTLGCQMNTSDSEEMAGALLAADQSKMVLMAVQISHENNAGFVKTGRRLENIAR